MESEDMMLKKTTLLECLLQVLSNNSHTNTYCPIIYQTFVHISHIFLTATGIPVLECCDVTAAV